MDPHPAPARPDRPPAASSSPVAPGHMSTRAVAGRGRRRRAVAAGRRRRPREPRGGTGAPAAYDDWSLPKGKLDPASTRCSARCARSTEETGFVARPGRRLGELRYDTLGAGRKRVRYWACRGAHGSFAASSEVDELCWLAVARRSASCRPATRPSRSSSASQPTLATPARCSSSGMPGRRQSDLGRPDRRPSARRRRGRPGRDGRARRLLPAYDVRAGRQPPTCCAAGTPWRRRDRDRLDVAVDARHAPRGTSRPSRSGHGRGGRPAGRLAAGPAAVVVRPARRSSPTWCRRPAASLGGAVRGRRRRWPPGRQGGRRRPALRRRPARLLLVALERLPGP